MQTDFRCNCPITTALDVFGDKWMLVIVKQMLIEGKKTFKDFTESDEAIATNILSTKLKLLQELGIVLKAKQPNNKKTNLYLLTDKGLALTEMVVELAAWSDKYLRDSNPDMMQSSEMELLRKDKQAFASTVKRRYKEQLSQIDIGQ